MSFSRGLKSKSAKVWEDGYNHPFVQELGNGKFKFYLLQDYLYLLQYAKVFATAVLKSDTEDIWQISRRRSIIFSQAKWMYIANI